MSTVTIMQGEGGSGKSTYSRHLCKTSGFTTVRVNRDDLRAMLFDGVWSGRRERLVRAVEQAIAHSALEHGYNVVVDDTNLTDSAQYMWKKFAEDSQARIVYKRMETSFEECVARDMLRDGRAHIGRAVIERQFLLSGRAKFSDKPIVIVDVDGTLANHEPHRSPYDESKVHMDTPYDVVCKWVRNLTAASGYCTECGNWLATHEVECNQDVCECTTPVPAIEYSVIVVSGRTDKCGDSTARWLQGHNIHSDHLFMRSSGDQRPDTVIKQEILDGILKYVPKEQIAFVIDDRPSVIEMWKSNGLRVFPARGAVEPF